MDNKPLFLRVYDYSAITLLIIVTIVGLVMIFSSGPKQIDGVTKQEAEMEYCKLVNSLKYPDSSTVTIDRLCYLEQIGKELAR